MRAIQLPAPGFNVPHGSIATITGWAIFMDNFEASVLETTQISIVENAQCEPPITRHIVRPDQICAVPEYDIEE